MNCHRIDIGNQNLGRGMELSLGKHLGHGSRVLLNLCSVSAICPAHALITSLIPSKGHCWYWIMRRKEDSAARTFVRARTENII